MSEEETRFEPGLKLARHPSLGRYLEGKFVSPINVEISPSGICNAACEFCFYRQGNHALPGWDKEMFKESRMERLTEEFAGMGVKSISWTGGGEPTIHPSFSKFIEWADWAGVQQGLFTNALSKVKYDPSIFEWIRVTRTNKDFNEDNLKILRASKTLGLCINYFGPQDDDIVRDTLEIAERLHDLRESPDHSTYVQLRPALKILGDKVDIPISNLKFEHPLLKITDYKFLGANSERGYSLCEGFHFTPFIWQDGDVDVCAYHRKKSGFTLGNLYTSGEEGRFEYIMRNAPQSVDVIPSCQVCCKPNAINEMINRMKNLEDVNFP